MSVRGTPVFINGRTSGTPGPATTTAVRIPIPVPAGRQIGGTPLAPATTFARELRIRNLDGTNNLLVYLLDNTYRTVLPNTEEKFTGTISSFAVQASASTVQWEATAITAS
jgi:hypothetical protein